MKFHEPNVTRPMLMKLREILWSSYRKIGQKWNPKHNGLWQEINIQVQPT